MPFPHDWSPRAALWLAYGIAVHRPWLSSLLLAACAHAPAKPPAPPSEPHTINAVQPEAHPEASAPTAQPRTETPAAALPGGLVELPLAGREAAVVSLPTDPAPRQPVLVVTHGAGGQAATHCSIWRAMIGARGFILCTQGRAMYPYLPTKGAGYYYDGHPELGDEMTEALAALAAAHGARVDAERPIFAGYSQGASMGSLVLPAHPGRFAHAVLVEGGFGQHQEWNIAAARRFHERGGRRVLLACGRSACMEIARTTAGYMRRGGLDVKLVYAEGAGHTYGEIMQRTVKAELAWLMQGDSRW